jgi:hypothetical protein
VQPIGFRTVTCEYCTRPFNINKDVINAAHEMLLFGCWGSIDRKEYMQCVLNVAQANEVFFSHFLHVQLIYRAYAYDGSNDVRGLNGLTQQLYDSVHRLTFDPMRRVFLRLVIDAAAPASLADAEVAIAALPKTSQDTPTVSRQDIEAMSDAPLSTAPATSGS